MTTLSDGLNASFSQPFLENLLRSLPEPIAVKNRQQQWVFLNDAFCNLVGYPQSDLLGKTVHDIFQPSEADLISNCDEQVFLTGLPQTCDVQVTNAQGERFLLSTYKYIFYSDIDSPFLVSTVRSIISKEQIEVELQESQHLLQLVVNNIPQLIFWKNRDSVYLGCNQQFAEFAGVDSPKKIVGKTDYDLCWEPEEAELYRTRDRHIIESDKAEYGLIEVKLQADGSIRWAEVNKVPLHDSKGNVIGILGTYEDITERKRAEETLRHSEATNRALIEAIPDLLIRMRDDGTYLDFSFHGDFKPTAIQAQANKNIYEVMPPDIAEERLRYARKALETGELQIYDQEVIINGQTAYEEVRLIPCGANEVLTMIRDVTDRKRAEKALQQLNENLEHNVESRTLQLKQVIYQLKQEMSDHKRTESLLQEKEQFLRTIYECIENQIFVINVSQDGNFHYGGWNRFTELQTGIASKNAIDKTPEDIFGPVEGAQVREKYALCLKTNKTVTYEEVLTFRGRKTWFITTLNPLKDEEGQIYRIVGTTFNITERKQAELALQQSEAQLRQQAEELEQALQELQKTQMQLVQSEKMSSLGQLVAGVAHEINNPVNFIYGNLKHAGRYAQDLLNLLQLYQKHYPDPTPEIAEEVELIDLDFLMDDLPKLLSSMKIGADRIQEIVASLRTFSRMDEAEMKAVDLHECIDSTLMILQNRLKAGPYRGKIEVIKNYKALPPVECYAGQLNQVFMNILSNAIDALDEAVALRPPDFVPSITLTVDKTSKDRVIVQIADNGNGISPEKQTKIFDPFFTTKPIGKGTGMGLSISYQIVTEKHGGRLVCHSIPGEGTEFAIVIPIHQSRSAHR